MTQRIEVLEDIFKANNSQALLNCSRLEKAGIFSLNLMASPGAGKTSLIEQTILGLKGKTRVAVIDGDIATSMDADRAEKAGATAVQINTGGECHLDAFMIRNALDRLDLSAIDILLIENVGNLVCPSAFRLGAHQNVLVASTPEGHDKPYKYPGMYQGVDVLIINKIDLLPYINFDMQFFAQGVEILNPRIRTFLTSCSTGEGIQSWIDWILHQKKSFSAV